MTKKILVTSTDLMMVQFLLPHIKFLREQGYKVDVACSVVGNRIDEVINQLGENSVYKLSLKRSPIAVNKIIKGYNELKSIIEKGKYDLVWTNEPVMGVITRLASKKVRKNGTKVMYMTHGYHFFKGCPNKLKIFYYIEKYFSKFCDSIVTINFEDFETTKSDFYIKEVFHINGIGLDTNKYIKLYDKSEIREELDIPKDAFVIMSVGELKPHKDHKTIIDAIPLIDNKNIYYILCGQGELKEFLETKAKENNISDRVKFLGYRKDISKLLYCADVFAFPSIREGLGLASLEAMCVGLPIVGSNTRGLTDYIINDETGYACNPNDPKDFAKAFTKLLDNDLRHNISLNCKEFVKKYDMNNIQNEILNIIGKIIE